jgi:hypothetical protein
MAVPRRKIVQRVGDSVFLVDLNERIAPSPRG